MKKVFAFILFVSASLVLADDVKISGLRGGYENLNTELIQKAIDDCSSSGGGAVIFPSGTYKTGFFVMKDNVVLKLKPDTIILGSENPSDYPKLNIPTADNDFNYTLIYAKNAKNIGIEGGTIRGQGEKFPSKGEARRHRPRNILFDGCTNVNLNNLTMLAPTFWNAFFLHCDGVNLDRLNIYVQANHNNDGLDIASKNVKITNCIINAVDDGICLKNEHSQDFVVENITIENCAIASSCNFIKIGTGTQSDFKNLKVRNCVLSRPSKDTPIKWWRNKRLGVDEGLDTGLAGIALEAVDGGKIDGVEIENVSMTGVQTPIFIRVDNRDRNNTTGKKSSAKNIFMKNITAVSDSFITSSITAPKGYELENVVIENCIFDIKGGVEEKAIHNKIREPKKAYPENRMFGKMLPAYGFFIRNAKNITFANIQLITHNAPEFRHAFYAENTKNLVLKDCFFQKPAGNAETLKFVNSQYKIEGRFTEQ